MRDTACRLSVLAAWVAVASSAVASAVEVHDLQGQDAVFGRYAPAGDCRRGPQVVVGAKGFVFEWDGRKRSPATFEFAVSYGPHDYAGISLWFFPINANEVKGSPYRRCT
ncbi:MAG: hypothetical protein AB7P31_05655 [Steroidobacteraceae bacterium]